MCAHLPGKRRAVLGVIQSHTMYKMCFEVGWWCEDCVGWRWDVHETAVSCKTDPLVRGSLRCASITFAVSLFSQLAVATRSPLQYCDAPNKAVVP